MAPEHLDRRARSRRRTFDDHTGRRRRQPAARCAGPLPGTPRGGAGLDPGDLALLPRQRRPAVVVSGAALLPGGLGPAAGGRQAHHLGRGASGPPSLSHRGGRTGWRCDGLPPGPDWCAVPGAQRTGGPGVSTRPLDADQLLRAGISAAELSAVAGTGQPAALNEGWTAVTAAGVGHASYAITGWGTGGTTPNLNALTGIRALSTTLSLTLSPGTDGGEVGLRGLVRISARNPAELEAADGRLQAVSRRLGVTLRPLRGLQVAGLAATLPCGTPRWALGNPAAAGTGAPEFLVTPGLLDAISPPGDRGGMVLGCGLDDEPLSVSVLRPQPTRLVLVGGLYLARQVALRAMATGAWVVVATGRPDAWQHLTRAAGEGPDGRPAPLVQVRRLAPVELPRASEDAPLLVVHDGGAVPQELFAPRSPWQTTLYVLPYLHPQAESTAINADLVLLQRAPGRPGAAGRRHVATACADGPGAGGVDRRRRGGVGARPLAVAAAGHHTRGAGDPRAGAPGRLIERG